MFGRISQKIIQKNSRGAQEEPKRMEFRGFSENQKKWGGCPQELARRSENKSNVAQNHAGARWGFRAKAIKKPMCYSNALDRNSYENGVQWWTCMKHQPDP
jgi:hypothetical protein